MDKKKAFFTTIPGILTGLATLIGAITGLIIASNEIFIKEPIVKPEPQPLQKHTTILVKPYLRMVRVLVMVFMK